MNRSLVALVLFVAMLMPAPAFAWFGWLDKLSGPGRFFGFLFEVRAICFGDREPGATLAAARELEATARASRNKQNIEAWRRAAIAWKTSALIWSVATGEDAVPTPEIESATEVDTLSKYIDEYKRFVFTQQDRTERAAGIGVLASVCPTGLVRRSSIDFAIDVYQQYHRREEFAGGAPIYLTMAKTSYSLPLFPKRKYDILDLSMGAGAFWFTSRGFVEPVRGLFLEPVRFYLHAPSRWGDKTAVGNNKKPSTLQRALTIPVLSAGAVVYPNGFAPNVFVSQDQLNRGQTQERIGSEVSWSVGVFINVHPTSKKIWPPAP
jgi:hypothetical protein